GDAEHAGVVVAEPEPDRQDRRVAVVELHPQGAAVLVDRGGGVQAAGGDAQVVQAAEGFPGEVAQIGVVTLALQLGAHAERQYHFVLCEPGDGHRVGQQDAGVEHIGSPLPVRTRSCVRGDGGVEAAAVGRGTSHSFSPWAPRGRPSVTGYLGPGPTPAQGRDRPSSAWVPRWNNTSDSRGLPKQADVHRLLVPTVPGSLQRARPPGGTACERPVKRLILRSATGEGRAGPGPKGLR